MLAIGAALWSCAATVLHCSSRAMIDLWASRTDVVAWRDEIGVQCASLLHLGWALAFAWFASVLQAARRPRPQASTRGLLTKQKVATGGRCIVHC